MPDDETAGLTPEQIAELLAEPKRTTGDTGTVENHSIPDVIAGDRYARSLGARGTFQLRKIVPGGPA